MKVNVKHFALQVFPTLLPLNEWEHYIECKLKKKKTEVDKAWLRLFRGNLKKRHYEVTVTHKPTGIKSTFAHLDKIDRRDLCIKARRHVNIWRTSQMWKSRDYKTYAGVHYETIGGVFTGRGSILSIGKDQHWKNPLVPKKPTAKSMNYVGVELEFNYFKDCPKTAEIGQKLKDAGYGRYVEVGTDPSCGYEVRCLFGERDWITPLTGILGIIKDMGFKCDSRCGVHVHLDMRNRDVDRIYKNFFNVQAFLRKLITKERKKNKYCKRNREAELNIHGRRRRGINGTAYMKHRTLEIRLHHGTLEASELIPWITVLLKVVNFKGNINKKVVTLKTARSMFDFDDILTAELSSRIDELIKRPPVEDNFAAMISDLNQLVLSHYTTTTSSYFGPATGSSTGSSVVYFSMDSSGHITTRTENV